MRVWIDLSNSPHPLLFAPIARALEEAGDEVAITFRDHAQTRELALERFPAAEPIGAESPGSRARKGFALLARARRLRRWARRFEPDVALSHNSYAQHLAARSIGTTTVTAMDYEHQPANHVGFRLADLVIVPEWFPPLALRRFGAPPRKVVRYPGFKEEVYLGDFTPDPGLLDRAGIAAGTRVAVVRTPPSRAIYHWVKNELLVPVVRRLGEAGWTCVVLARHPEQVRELEREAIPNLLMPDQALDSRSLLWSADLFVGAGGTMTREAALLGVPTLTIFAGRPAAVDLELERRGLVTRLRDPAQVPDAQPPHGSREKVDLTAVRGRGARIRETFVDAVHESGAR